MSERGDSIVAAGRLTRPEARDGTTEPRAERSPYVSVNAGGRINLCYIARNPGARGWKVHSAPLEIDHKTGEPHLQVTTAPARSLSDELTAVALAGSADGESVFAFTRNGNVQRFSIPQTVR